MSAYSASAPVTASTTAPRTKNPCAPFRMKNEMPSYGFSAARMCGSFPISRSPSTPIVMNHERQKGHDAALAAIVRPQDEDEIFHAHHEQECPGDQGQEAVDVRLRGRVRVWPGEARLEGIQRTGADVTVDDPERRER